MSDLDRPPEVPAWRRWVWPAVVVVGVLVAVGVFVWPTVGRSSDRIDVVVAGDGFVDEAREVIERRFRERGLGVETLAERSGSLCADRERLLDVVDREDPTVVVLSYRSAEQAEGACGPVSTATTPSTTAGVYDEVVDALGPARVVLAIQPGAPGTEEAQAAEVREAYYGLLEDRRASVADPSPLLGGDAAPVEMRCQWWDICDPTGLIQVREADAGPLTAPGGERFARVIVGVVP